MELARLLEKRDFYLNAKENSSAEIERKLAELRAKLEEEAKADLVKIDHYISLLDELIAEAEKDLAEQDKEDVACECEATEEVADACAECAVEEPVAEEPVAEEAPVEDAPVAEEAPLAEEATVSEGKPSFFSFHQ